MISSIKIRQQHKENIMGSCIQVAIDIKFKHQDFKHVEREIYHYQDSG